MDIIYGIAFLFGIIAFIYVIRYIYKNSDPKNTHTYIPKTKQPQDPKPEDIVLAKLTSGETQETSNAILWNGTPNKSYNYTISDVSTTEPTIVASGTIVCPESGLVKIKDIPIEDSAQYQVHVDETSVDVIFEPPNFILPVSYEGKTLECKTDIPPTGIEILADNEKVPLGLCNILLDPNNPGLSCELPENISTGKEFVIMVYNGPNAVNIFSQ